MLAAALAYSVFRQGKVSAVLQLAGGEANAPGSKLYTKFGFVPDRGTFGPPNENLMVLWDIEDTLRDLSLSAQRTSAFESSVQQAATEHQVVKSICLIYDELWRCRLHCLLLPSIR